MRRLAISILILIVLLTTACSIGSRSGERIAVLDWQKAVDAHPRQAALKRGEAEARNLLVYRGQQSELAKTQLAGLARLQQLKQSSKANFMDADFQTQMYAAEESERKKMLAAYDAAVQEADLALREQEKELEDSYQLRIVNLRLRLAAVKMRPEERESAENELRAVQTEREQQRQQILAAKNKLISEKMEPLLEATKAKLQQRAMQLHASMDGDMLSVIAKDEEDFSKVPESLTKAMATIDTQIDKLQESNEKIREDIKKDIESNVVRLSHERKYTIVFHSVKANVKAEDITEDVIKALQKMN